MFSYPCHHLLHHFQFTLIRGPNGPGSSVILFLTTWTLLSLPDTSTTEHRFCLGPDASFFLGLSVIAVYSSPVSYWVPSDPGGSSSGVISFCLFMMFVRFLSQEYWSGRHFLLQGTSFCQNSSLWFVHLGWPCMAWLIASLSCTSPFTMRRLWSMKRCSRDMD